MTTDDTNIIGFVTDCYDHDEKHRVLEVQSNDQPGAKVYHFFFIPRVPEVDFGDRIQMNFDKGEFYVYRGNSRLTFKINPEAFPGTLLIELMQQRLYLDTLQ